MASNLRVVTLAICACDTQTPRVVFVHVRRFVLLYLRGYLNPVPFVAHPNFGVSLSCSLCQDVTALVNSLMRIVTPSKSNVGKGTTTEKLRAAVAVSGTLNEEGRKAGTGEASGETTTRKPQGSEQHQELGLDREKVVMLMYEARVLDAADTARVQLLLDSKVR